MKHCRVSCEHVDPFGWDLLDLSHDLFQIGFHDVLVIRNPGDFQAEGDVLVTFATGDNGRNVSLSQLLEIAVPDPTGIDSVGVVRVEQANQENFSLSVPIMWST